MAACWPEVERALRWIDQLEREQGREEIEERAGRYQRRMAKKRAAREKVAAVVKLVPPAS